MKEREFWPLINLFRDSRIWRQDDRGAVQRAQSVVRNVDDPGIDPVRLIVKKSCDFRLTPSKALDIVDDQYLRIGCGWVDDWTAFKRGGAVHA